MGYETRKKRKCMQKYIQIGPSPKKRDAQVSSVLPKTTVPSNNLLAPKTVSTRSPKTNSILLQKMDKEVPKTVANPPKTRLMKLNEKKTFLKELRETAEDSVVLKLNAKKPILKKPPQDNFVILGKKEKKKVNQERSILSFLSNQFSPFETEKPFLRSCVQTDGNVVLSKQKKKSPSIDKNAPNIVVFDDTNILQSDFVDLTNFLTSHRQEKIPQTEKELKSSLAPFLKVKDKKKNLLSQIMSEEKKTDADFVTLASNTGLGKRLEIKCFVNQNGENVYVDKEGFFYLQTSCTNVSKSLKCSMSSDGCTAKAMMYEKDHGYIYLKEIHNHETDFTQTF